MRGLNLNDYCIYEKHEKKKTKLFHILTFMVLNIDVAILKIKPQQYIFTAKHKCEQIRAMQNSRNSIGVLKFQRRKCR